MKDFKGNELHVGDKVVYIIGKSLYEGVVTKVYDKPNKSECSVDNTPHIYSSRVMKL